MQSLKLKQDIQVMKEQKRIEMLLAGEEYINSKRKKYNNFSFPIGKITIVEKKDHKQKPVATNNKQKLIEELIAKQNNLCPICEDNLLEVRPNLDHCHRTNMIRGVLCNSCNVGLGFFADNPKFLEAGITYLNKEYNIVNDGYCKVRSR
jgi:hypothetical protein